MACSLCGAQGGRETTFNSVDIPISDQNQDSLCQRESVFKHLLHSIIGRYRNQGRGSPRGRVCEQCEANHAVNFGRSPAGQARECKDLYSRHWPQESTVDDMSSKVVVLQIVPCRLWVSDFGYRRLIYSSSSIATVQLASRTRCSTLS